MNEIQHSLEETLQMLASDVLPDARTTASMRAVIGCQEKRMEQLDDEIAFLECRICELQAQKTILEQRCNVNKAILAPIRRLPPEILIEIFLRCVSVQSHTELYSQISPTAAPFLFTKVCSRWRRIALSWPRLWTVCYGRPADLRHSLPFWLSHSGSVPIDVHISNPGDNQSWKTLACLVVENFGRLRSITGNMHFDYLEAALIQAHLRIDAPHLEFWDLSSHISGEFEIESRLRGCINAPRLTGLVIQDSSLYDIISFPTHCLRSLELNSVDDDFTYSQMMELLSNIPNISYLKLEIYGGFDLPLSPNRQIVLSHLHTLVVSHHHFELYDLMQPYKGCIGVPVLHTLHVSHWGDDCAVDVGELLISTMDALLFGEDPSLQELIVTGSMSSMVPADFIAGIGNLPNLRLFRIEQGKLYDFVLKALTVDPSWTPTSPLCICPKLTELDIVSSHFSKEYFLEMVRSRVSTSLDTSTGIAHLRRIKIESQREDLGEIISALKNIVRLSGGLPEIEEIRLMH